MANTSAGRSVDARCPFYRQDGTVVIRCEGLTEESSIQQSFANARACSIQFDTFCSCHYERCELYDAIRKAKYLPDTEEEV